jgi:hypothetical protein
MGNDWITYRVLEELVAVISEPNQSRCFKFLDENREVLRSARGSKSKHQAWAGGYLDHLTETMNIAVRIYEPLNNVRRLPFKLSDVLLVLFLHDIEKPWKYSADASNFVPQLESKRSQHEFRLQLIEKYGFELTDEHLDALQYVEGEGANWSPDERKMGRLGAFCHMCDVCSARLWFDEPKTKNSW